MGCGITLEQVSFIIEEACPLMCVHKGIHNSYSNPFPLVSPRSKETSLDDHVCVCGQQKVIVRKKNQHNYPFAYEGSQLCMRSSGQG